MSGEQAIVFGSLLLAVVLVLVRAATIRHLDLSKDLGQANWDFSKSWASTFTVLAAITAFFSTPATLAPKPGFLQASTSYVALSLAFAMIVTATPFLYRATATPKPAGGDPPYVGSVRSFLVCTALTTWATVGQLVTASLLILEAQPVAISSASAFAFAASLFVIGLFVIGYIFRAMKPIIEPAPKLKGQTVPQVVSPPNWSLL